MDRAQLLAQIDAAQREISAAGSALQQLLHDATRAPRAEKTTISDALEGALERVSAARTLLAGLQATVLGSGD